MGHSLLKCHLTNEGFPDPSMTNPISLKSGTFFWCVLVTSLLFYPHLNTNLSTQEELSITQPSALPRYERIQAAPKGLCLDSPGAWNL